MNVKQCRFVEAWVGKCEEVPAAGFDMCEKHKGRICVSCKQKAVRNCEHTSALVCGADLCATCTHGILMPGAPYSFMGMGGGHVTKEKYAEMQKEYQRIEPMILNWQTVAGEDCCARSKFGNFYVLINHDTSKFVASINNKQLSKGEIDTKGEAMELCQKHHIALCEAIQKEKV